MIPYIFDTQLLVNVKDQDVDDMEDVLRDFILTQMKGDSLVLASFEDEDKYGAPANFIKIHFHTNEPWQLLEFAASKGELFDVVVENMDRQERGLKG